uniref:Uncharacterized protein n=1 Tax=Panagrolaimus superbus TaxID=310955 RepID=A0A914YNQ7_9BILA
MNLDNARPADINPGIVASGSVGHRLETLKGCCGVPARLSGFFSWCIQLIILLISVVVTALIFVHIGGYGYFLSSSHNNETEIVKSFSNDDLSESFVTIDPQELYNETMKETVQVVRILEGNETEYQIKEIQKTYQGPFEQITEVNLKVGKFVISLLPVLRTINVIYIIFCVLWLASLGCLLLSLKLELLDLCVCLTSLSECIKRRKRGANRDQAASAAGYAIPEATTHSALPYIDEGPVTHFSNF